MLKKRPFSLIELITVILVIMVLLSLLLPTISRVKKSAHNVLCSKNLKDLHALIMSYSVDHENYLPGYNISDHSADSKDTWEYAMYKNWNGHLIPYIDIQRTNGTLSRNSKFQYDGKWHRSNPGLNDSRNHELYKDAEKGAGPFKMFFCPEIISSIIDPGLYYIANAQYNTNVEIPKMYATTLQISYAKGFGGFGYGPQGYPTTYAANDTYFRRAVFMDPNSNIPHRVSEFQNFGKKALLIEGGVNTSTTMSDPYFYGRDKVNYLQLGFQMLESSQFSYTSMSLTFPHDDEGEFWWSGFSDKNGIGVFKKELLNQYNELFAPEAYVGFNTTNSLWDGGISGTRVDGMTIVTHTNPMTNSKYLDAVKNMIGIKWVHPFNYNNNSIIYNPGLGKANVLFGDGSVATKHNSWLFANRMDIFTSL